MRSYLSNIRFYVLVISFFISILVFSQIKWTTNGISQIVDLDQDFALTSIICLYLTLLAGPFCYRFKAFPFRSQYLKSRRALGVSAFYFALLHTYFAFFDQLQGFSGLGFLDNKYLLALAISFMALIILSLLALTSFDWAVEKLKFKNWKMLHRLVYLAGILILVHVLLLGTHFSNLSDLIPKISFLALAFLLVLEAPRLDKILAKFAALPKLGFSSVVILVILAVVYFGVLSPLSGSSSGISLDIHAAHKLLAQQEEQSSVPDLSQLNIPGLDGDRTKRYTVSFNNPDNAQPNQDVSLKFRVYDAENGNPVDYFHILYAKEVHCIIVNSQLNYFSHIHPIQDQQNEFEITTQFPQTGIYHIYLEFQPFGGIEQQIGFTFQVGQNQQPQFSTQPADKTLTKVFENYAVTLDTHGTLSAQAMSLGQDTISFEIKNAKTGQPITTLKPYLDAFGHLTMIDEKTYNFIHVHPSNLTVPPPDSNGGPIVNFLPIGIYGPFKRGTYRMFAEFNPDGNLFTADFTVDVK